MSKQAEKRIISFWKSDSPLTSKRVSAMLSDPESSKKLAKTVRRVRHNSTNVKGKGDSFKVEVSSEP